MLDHHQFEELAFLAALGELSPEEHQEFIRHKDSCRTCAHTMSETSSLASAMFLAGEPDLQDEAAKAERHQRMRANINHALPVVVQARRNPGFIWAGVAATFVIGLSLGATVRIGPIERIPTAPTAPPALVIPSTTATSGITSKEKDFVSAQRAIAELQKRVQELRADNLLLREKLAISDQHESVMTANLNDVQKRFKEEDQQVLELRVDLSATTSEAAKARGLLTASEERIETLQRDLADRDARLTEVSASLNREREMLSAGREIRDIMGARELHIVDVVDRDSKGKAKKAFGRAFYTQGKSLIFYAFDLPTKNTTDGKFVYAAWGSNSNDLNHRVSYSLGIVYDDDRAQHRWAMKFEDPKLLEEIDTVFITLEPAGQPFTAPTGKPLLEAYFGTPPNHP